MTDQHAWALYALGAAVALIHAMQKELERLEVEKSGVQNAPIADGYASELATLQKLIQSRVLPTEGGELG